MVTQTMASQNVEENEKTETVPGGLTPDDVGMEFVRQYFTLLNQAPHYLYRLYSKESKFVHGSIVGKHQTPIIGQEKIRVEIERLNFQEVYTRIRQVDCYSTLHDLLIVLICGEISILKNPARRFAQQIVLAPQGPLKYYVVNDVFRYIDEDCSDGSLSGQQQGHETQAGMETESSEGGQDDDVIRGPQSADGLSSNQLQQPMVPPNDLSGHAPSVTPVAAAAPNVPSADILALPQQQQLMRGVGTQEHPGVTAANASVAPSRVTGAAMGGSASVAAAGLNNNSSSNATPAEQDYLLINSRAGRPNGTVVDTAVSAIAPPVQSTVDMTPPDEHANNFDVFQQDSQMGALSSGAASSLVEPSSGEIQPSNLNEQAAQFNDVKPAAEDGLDDASTTVQLSVCNETQSEESAAPVAETTNGGIKTWASVTTGMGGSSPAKKAPIVSGDSRLGASSAAAPAGVVSGSGAQFQAGDNFASAKPQRGPSNRNSGRQQPYAPNHDNSSNMNSGALNENRGGFDRKNMTSSRGGSAHSQFNGQSQNGYQQHSATSAAAAGSNHNMQAGGAGGATFPPASESPNPVQMGGERGGPVPHFGGGGRGGSGGGNWAGSSGGAGAMGASSQMGGAGAPGGFQSAPDDFQIFVGNLPSDVIPDELKRRFSEFGTVVDVRINRGSGGIPFGFVVFDNRDSVHKILELTQGPDHQTKIYVRNNTHRINIEEKKPRSGGPLNRGSGGRYPPGGGMKQGGGGPGGGGGNWSGGNNPNQAPPRGPAGDGSGGGKFMKGGPGGGGSMNKPRGGGGGKFGANDSHSGGGSMNGGGGGIQPPSAAAQQQSGAPASSFNNHQPFQSSYGPRR